MEKFLKVGVITSPHGVRGEFKVYPTTDDSRRFLELDEIYVKRPGSDGEGAPYEVENVKFFKNMVILKISGVDTVEDASRLRNADLMIPREQGVELAENEYYTADIIGMRVFTDDGEELGELTDIIQTGANDVYSVRTGKYGDVLIPAVKDCIISVNVEDGTMTVHLLPGLLP